MYLFVCFAAEDRYNIVEPLVYHLRNYGVPIWYDRYALLMSDNRIKKNLEEGAGRCKYALVVLSKNTDSSTCAMEELSIIRDRYFKGDITVFPVLYELSPDEIPYKLQWVKQVIFKETDRKSGTHEICNHIACKISDDIINEYCYKSIQDVIKNNPPQLSKVISKILSVYQKTDSQNLNSRISLLYAVYLILSYSESIESTSETNMASKIFERLWTETQLNLKTDYRDLWLLENALCILIDNYIASCTESKM